MGLPYLRSAIAQQAGQEQYRLLAGGFAVLLLSLALLFRRRSAVLIPLATASLSVVWLLGGMAFLGIPLNVLTAAVPVLLVIIGSTEDVHLLAEYYAAASGRCGRSAAIRRMARRLGLAVGLTFLTSCLGFVAVSTNPIGLVREFGLVAAVGLAVNFVLTILLVPILLGMLGEQTARSRPRAGADHTRRPPGVSARRLLAHRRLIIGAGLAATAGFGYLAVSLHIDNSMFRYLPTGSEAHQRAAAMQRDLAGIHTFQIVVDGHIDGAFERVRYLEELRRIQRHIDRHSPFDHSLSFADYMAVLNSAVNDSGEPGLPERDAVVETLMLFVDAADVREFLSADASKASIVVRHGIAASHELRAAVQRLAAQLDVEVDPDLEVTITGQSVLASEAAGDLARGQIKSLSLILLAVFIVVSLLFMRAMAGLIAALVAGVPMVALFGIMGAAGIPLDSATSMIAAIAVGVGVDHTVHVMVRYRHHLGGGAESLDAIVRTLQDEARPIGAASLALALGFATLTLSEFLPVYWFGLLSAAMVVFGLLASITLAPALLSYVRLSTVWDLPGSRPPRDASGRAATNDRTGRRSAAHRRRVLISGTGPTSQP
jgi:hypothetical protein